MTCGTREQRRNTPVLQAYALVLKRADWIRKCLGICYARRFIWARPRLGVGRGHQPVSSSVASRPVRSVRFLTTWLEKYSFPYDPYVQDLRRHDANFENQTDQARSQIGCWFYICSCLYLLHSTMLPTRTITAAISTALASSGRGRSAALLTHFHHAQRLLIQVRVRKGAQVLSCNI